MIAYRCDTNEILQASFATRLKKRIAAYNSIMKRLTDKGQKLEIQILDNEASAKYKRVITKKWQAQYQLVPPNVHQRNVSERAIRNFKAHLLSILAGVDPNFPKYMWDTLLQQTELTINLLRQATINQKIGVGLLQWTIRLFRHPIETIRQQSDDKKQSQHKKIMEPKSARGFLHWS